MDGSEQTQKPERVDNAVEECQDSLNRFWQTVDGQHDSPCKQTVDLDKRSE